MKKEFDSFGQQMTYINRYIHRYTDIELVCQYCGNKGRIRYYRDMPEKIHIVCLDCANKRDLFSHKNLGKVLDDIPLISVEEHISNPIILNKMIKLDTRTKSILRNLLKSTKPKYESYKETGLTLTILNRLIDEYTEKVDKDFKIKLKNHFAETRSVKIRDTRLKSVTDENSHPIKKLKLERGLTNKDIADLTNNKITVGTLCMIQEYKSKPRFQTKIMLAEALNVSLTDIFPEESEFKDVYSWNDFWFNYRNKVLKSLNVYVTDQKSKGKTYILKTLSEDLGVTESSLYALKEGQRLPTNRDVKLLKEHNIFREDV